jgi:hypothetical protein
MVRVAGPAITPAARVKKRVESAREPAPARANAKAAMAADEAGFGFAGGDIMLVYSASRSGDEVG